MEPAGLEDANLVGSLTPRGTHWPVLDCDYPTRSVPSTSGRHSHVYLDVEVSWPRLVIFLLAAAHAGIIEWAFAWTSIWRGMTAVRCSWVKKRLADGNLADEWRRAARGR